jgi:polar amino acid transport system permease protein
LIGIICSLIGYYKVPVLRQITGIYIELSRNTPLLVQLFLLYFGLPKAGIVISSEWCAIIGLSFLGGSYMAEAFRSGLESVEKGQMESALAIGLTHAQTMRYVIFPQAMAVSIPALCANVIFLIKETSVFSVVALADLMYVAKDLIGLYYQTDEALLMLVLAYLVLLLPISIAATWLERRLRYAGFGN